MSEHTKGPWIVDPNIPGNPTIRGGRDYKVGICNARPEDARLIAAAPELLEAAGAVLEVDDSWEPCDIPACKGCEAMSQLRVAVAKAEGR